MPACCPAGWSSRCTARRARCRAIVSRFGPETPGGLAQDLGCGFDWDNGARAGGSRVVNSRTELAEDRALCPVDSYCTGHDAATLLKRPLIASRAADAHDRSRPDGWTTVSRLRIGEGDRDKRPRTRIVANSTMWFAPKQNLNDLLTNLRFRKSECESWLTRWRNSGVRRRPRAARRNTSS